MATTLRFDFRRDWRELRRGRPGRRFQDRYESVRNGGRRNGKGKRVVLVVFALVFFAIGCVLVVMPGPAFLFFILAGGILATESRLVAQFMDWSEVRVRTLLTWGKANWRRLPFAARTAVVVITLCCAALLAYWAYGFIRG